MMSETFRISDRRRCSLSRKLERLLRHPGFQAPRDELVLTQCQDLPYDDEGDHRDEVPAGELTQRLAVERVAGKHDQRQDDGYVGQERAVARPGPGGLGQRRLDRRQGEKEISDDPPGVGQLGAPVGTLLGQPGKRAVGHRERGHAHPDPQERDRFSRPASAGDDHHGREDHHVTHRVGQGDDLRERAAGPRLVRICEHHQPADQQRRRAHDQSIQTRAQARGQAHRRRVERQHPSQGERHRHEKASIGRRRKRDRTSEQDLVVGPDGLADPPRQRRGAEQDPSDANPAGITARRVPAPERGRERRDHRAEIIDTLGDARAADAQKEPNKERHAERCGGHNGRRKRRDRKRPSWIRVHPSWGRFLQLQNRPWCLSAPHRAAP